MEYYKYIFVVCTYGASEDLKNFIKSVNGLNISCKIIVANSFCSDETLSEIRTVATSNKCDFLDLPNKGYGHSLNEGIVYATQNYNYDFIAITNADILIKRIEINKSPEEAFLVAPEIKTLTGKRQNPFYVYPYFKLFKIAKWIKETFHKGSILVMVVAKIHRIIFNLLFGSKPKVYRKIYAGHGAFIVFSKEAIKKVSRPFEDDIFLYCEENFIGYKMRKLGIPYYYSSDVSVIHTEDGSNKFYKHTINGETIKSMEKYYELIKND